MVVQALGGQLGGIVGIINHAMSLRGRDRRECGRRSVYGWALATIKPDASDRAVGGSIFDDMKTPQAPAFAGWSGPSSGGGASSPDRPRTDDAINASIGASNASNAAVAAARAEAQTQQSNIISQTCNDSR